jgi:hypothetical protein
MLGLSERSAAMQSLPKLVQQPRADQGQFSAPRMIPADDAIALAAVYRLLSDIAGRANATSNEEAT